MTTQATAPAPTRALPLVLLVDDDPEILAALRRCLRSPDYQLIAVSSPRDAARLIEGHRIDVIISDVDMPGLSGHDLMALARTARPAAVRILLTGTGTLESAVRAINEGEVHRYLTKPFDPGQVRRLLADALARQAELGRTSEAADRLDRRRMLLAQLEEEHPGITAVPRTATGAYPLDPEQAAADAAGLGLAAFYPPRRR